MTLSNERIAYFNGRYVPDSEVRVPSRDHGWVLGDDAFNMTRTFNGRVFKIEETSSASTAPSSICATWVDRLASGSERATTPGCDPPSRIGSCRLDL
jgi:hypothetical protein